MSWGKFSLRSIVTYLVLWCLLIYAYSSFYLVNNVVPEQGTEISAWINSYYRAGAVSAVLSFITSAVWFKMGKSYAGGIGISTRYNLLWIISLALGAIAAFFLIMPSLEGKGLSFLLVTILAPIGYYISALIAPASAVKYIPLFAESIHK